jgi:hypothetical protein
MWQEPQMLVPPWKSGASSTAKSKQNRCGLNLSECKEETMSANSKQSVTWTLVLILLGMAALYGGSRWLTILIPAAGLVWYIARPMLRTGRN